MGASLLWWSAKAAFVLLCLLGAVLFVLWLAGVAISAHAVSRQPRRGNHRVGGALK
jgi:hypothetical protein